ncbi:aspartate aminotransferase family protein [Domibacillus sp. DTU_2020_1001157_1_SI_ALB_TIR_016]|uniref:aspartate aminotransferase family protein n=1 Tax=Domibacillus sp. DTU_2020_1001157_1_SI_ALB_TIR_016 TaxID=3077789 RepID=UPI0028EDF2AB|nr:aspartate aminotransferase family protein [Domibacillus sp. DTU_2020_1001157_1_SI_ALB_TIR_016]WNS79029.1 aspartate aminotransferase family protein [Domibacillus sp. DTU_2020_1001157_1_SI_ALB_TIR_016]
MKTAKTDVSSLIGKDRANVWHHISPYIEEKPPMVIQSGQGAWITDHQGDRYLDGMSGLWCVNVGYGREELAKAAYDQMLEMAYVPMTQSHVPAIELAEKLNELLGGGYMIFYSNSGSDANEVAFKLARQFHQQNGEPSRFKFLSRHRAYHGSSMGALSATGQALRKFKYEPLAPGFLHVSPPDSYRRPAGMSVEDYNIMRAEEFEQKIIWEQKETIAGIIMEPLITGGGILTPHPVYMEKVQEICRKYGILLIIDEVICGFGRTGKYFGHQHFGIKPDIITMAKGLTSAYLPLSVTAVRKDIYETFKNSAENSHFRHINTFGGNPAACAVALKNLEIIERERLVERSELLGARLQTELAELKEHPHVGDIRGLGFLLGIEMVENKETKEPASAERVASLIAACKKEGLIIGKNGDTVEGSNNVLTLSPPLSCTDEDVDFIISVLKKVFTEL